MSPEPQNEAVCGCVLRWVLGAVPKFVLLKLADGGSGDFASVDCKTPYRPYKQ